MRTTDSLKLVERQAYRSIFEDGIYDILFGIVFLILAWIPVLESIGIPRLYGFLFAFIPVLLAWLAKRYITVPRLGAVEFGPKRKTRRLSFLIICVAFLFLTFPLLLMMSAEGFGSNLAGDVGLPMTVGLVVAPIIVVAAYALDCPRMYIYAALVFVGIPHAEFLYEYIGKPLNSVVSFGAPGAVILVYGLILLFRFLRKYPVPSVEVHHAD